ncbi:hypothetical protein DFH09DRAFT_1095086 [Mycena vulgaris]|nr:hypothetical protein DFH09DRAFT_1095086 [Mycena vulgaris]
MDEYRIRLSPIGLNLIRLSLIGLKPIGLSSLWEFDGHKHGNRADTGLGNGDDSNDSLRIDRVQYGNIDGYNCRDCTMTIVEPVDYAGYFWLVQTKAFKDRRPSQKVHLRYSDHHESPRMQHSGQLCFAWNREWDTTVPKLIHHPDVPMSCAALLNLLNETDIYDLCEPCRTYTATRVLGTGHVTQEEKLFDEAITALMSLQTDGPIRAALHNNIVEFAK